MATFSAFIMSIFILLGIEKVKELSEKWFGQIPKGKLLEKNLPQEPLQKIFL